MTTSLKAWSNYTSDNETPITRSDKAYFRARTRKHVHDVVLRKFVELADSEGMSKAKIARRLSVHPAQVTRWLSSPGNWTIDTLSDLLLAMNCQASVLADELMAQCAGNYFHELAAIPSIEEKEVSTKNREYSRVVIRLRDSNDVDCISTS